VFQFGGGETLGRLEDEDFGVVALLYGGFLDGYDVGDDGARRFESVFGHGGNRRHEDRTGTVAILRSYDARAVDNGFPVPDVEGFI
jgi:hypothetical protein